MKVRRQVRLGEWEAIFDPRPIDIAGTDLVVVVEVWDRNDYRIDPEVGLSGTVIDIGANIGAFTVLASRAGADHVIAIEPEARNFARLAHHVLINGCEKVTLLNVAVTETGVDRVQMAGEGGGAQINHMPLQTIGGQYERDHEVAATSLPVLVAEYGPISLLKIDIEGGEFPIFADPYVTPDLLANIDRIEMEWHGPASPHLTHLAGDEFGPLVTTLAEAGRVETIGRPSFGGLLHWARY